MRKFFRSLFFSRLETNEISLSRIRRYLEERASWSERELCEACRAAGSVEETIAITAIVARRILGLEMFDVQFRAALALARGRIVEMQTGEGKTLAAVPAVVWLARERRGVHVMTVNDYLAGRDAKWMGGIYEALGFTVGCVRQGMSPDERRLAYARDITYATANEVGFDFLRDQLALDTAGQVHRPFSATLIDEADSILIDEARIPLVIAGGEEDEGSPAIQAERIVRHLSRGTHFLVGKHARNVGLTDGGIRAVEAAFRCGNLYAEENLPLLTAVQDALHARALLHRDVDYIVKEGAIESVDEFQGRVARDRRWPAGLHAAIEAKENLTPRAQGRILGSITLQNLIALYPRVAGMTGTAATQADEFLRIYDLDVEVIPTHRPLIRVDHPDRIYPTRREKEQAVLEEIRDVHRAGRPVLIGTASVAESERLSALLEDVPHQVLNARHEEREAELIAAAGQMHAVTISTNMAGRGTDIALGPGVAARGGLHVVGTNRHEARRIDLQLRGRAGRQGDPGSSVFLVSLEDDIMVRFGEDTERLHHTPASVQRVVESKNLEIRLFLQKYEGAPEGQRQRLHHRRQQILEADGPNFERMVTLRTMDDLWADHLAAVTELRTGIQWVSWGGRDPLFEFLTQVDRLFRHMMDGMDEEVARRLESARADRVDPSRRGATWTYLTTDNPFGSLSDRILKGMILKVLQVTGGPSARA